MTIFSFFPLSFAACDLGYKNMEATVLGCKLLKNHFQTTNVEFGHKFGKFNILNLASLKFVMHYRINNLTTVKIRFPNDFFELLLDFKLL